MTVTVTTTRNSFAGNGNQGPHSIGFTILDATHIQVYWDKGSSSPGTPTGLSASGYLTKDTHYTVQNAGTSSNATITYIATGWTVSSTVTYPPSGDTIVVTRNVALTQGSDYTNNSTIDAETIENSFDKLTQITQQLDDGKDYSIKFASNLAGSTGFNSTADTAGTITQNKSDRISKILAFDANGDISVTQELGTYRGDWATGQNYVLRDLVKQSSASDSLTQNNVYICTTAHASTGTYLTENDTSNWTLVLEVAAAQASANTATTQATNAANSATAAANSATASANSATTASNEATTATTKASEASTSASNAASSATAAATSAANAAASYDSFDDRYLGTFSSNPTQDNDGNALVTGALYFNTSDGEMKVYDGGTWIAASAAQNATVEDYTYTLSGSDSTISGADDNSATLSFSSQESVDVFLNGVKLVPKIGATANDYHLDTANTVTLTSTAVSGDVILVRVYKTFTVGDAVPASTGGTFSGDVTVPNLIIGDGGNIGSASDTDALTIDSSGNVGVGTGSVVDELLHVKNATGNARLKIESDQASSEAALKLDVNATSSFASILFQEANTDKAGIVYRTTEEDLGFRTGGASVSETRMTIDSSGNVGIGGSATEHLSIEGSGSQSLSIYSTDTGSVETEKTFIKMFGKNTGGEKREQARISSSPGHTASNAGQLIFSTNDSSSVMTQRMIIREDGNVGIGTSGSPQKKLHVEDNTADFMTRFANDGDNANRSGIEIQAGKDSPSASGDILWVRLADGNGSGKAYIQFKSSSPNVEFAAISDARLKNNISDTDVVGLDILNSIKMRKFDWDEEKTKAAGWSQVGSEKIGYIAQEVEEILPEFVSTDPMSDFKTMGDTGFIPYLIKAVQELSAKVTALENA